MIALRELSARVGDFALEDVSFVVPRGRSVCVLGRSGTGKSVTLRHIIGLMRPDAGAVLVDGQDITRMNSRELSQIRKRIGFLFQYAALFDSITVGANDKKTQDFKFAVAAK